jgi:hypothetical protein
MILSLFEACSCLAGQEISFLYGTIRFITVFAKYWHWTLPRAMWIQFAHFHRISLSSISVLSSHLCLGLPSTLLPSGFITLYRKVVQIINKSFPFMKLEKFIPGFCRTPPLNTTESFRSTQDASTIVFRYTLIVSSHLGVSGGYFPSGFPAKVLIAFYISFACCVLCPSHYI